MGFADSTIPAKVALIVLPLGGILNLVGIATPYWLTTPEDVLHYGLWSGCVQSVCGSIDTYPNWLGACRGFAVLSILTGGLCFIFHLISILKSDKRGLKIGALGLALASGILAIVAVGIFGGKYLELTTPVERDVAKLGYSLILSAVGGAIKIVGGVLLIVNLVTS